MTRLNIAGVLSLGLLVPTTLALPQFWQHGNNVKPYPTLTVSSSDGVYPTGLPGSTGTGTGTGSAYYPTATGSAYIIKREPDHPYGYPPPDKPSATASHDPSGQPTGSIPPILSTYFPTGTAPSASGTGTGLPYPTYTAAKREVDAAHQAHREHFEGPRKRDLKPYYPYSPSQSYDGGAGPTATGSGGVVVPTGTTPVPLPVPTGTVIIPPPMPTGATGTVTLPVVSGYSTIMA